MAMQNLLLIQYIHFNLNVWFQYLFPKAQNMQPSENESNTLTHCALPQLYHLFNIWKFTVKTYPKHFAAIYIHVQVLYWFYTIWRKWSISDKFDNFSEQNKIRTSWLCNYKLCQWYIKIWTASELNRIVILWLNALLNEHIVFKLNTWLYYNKNKNYQNQNS